MRAIEPPHRDILTYSRTLTSSELTRRAALRTPSAPDFVPGWKRLLVVEEDPSDGRAALAVLSRGTIQRNMHRGFVTCSLLPRPRDTRVWRAPKHMDDCLTRDVPSKRGSE